MTTMQWVIATLGLTLAPGTVLAQSAPEGGSELSIVTDGDASIGGELLCPDGTHRVGSWCIGPQQGPSAYSEAMQACWAENMQLCPLQAVLACDIVQPAGADCTAATDATPTTWIWCAEQPTADDVNAFTGGEARIFAHQGNHTQNEADFAAKTEALIYFCCLPRR